MRLDIFTKPDPEAMENRGKPGLSFQGVTSSLGRRWSAKPVIRIMDDYRIRTVCQNARMKKCFYLADIHKAAAKDNFGLVDVEFPWKYICTSVHELFLTAFKDECYTITYY